MKPVQQTQTPQNNGSDRAAIDEQRRAEREPLTEQLGLPVMEIETWGPPEPTSLLPGPTRPSPPSEISAPT